MLFFSLFLSLINLPVFYTAYSLSNSHRNCFSMTRHEILSREKLYGPPHDFHRGGKYAGEWFQNNAEPSIRCLTDERMGPWGDGGKWICQPSCLLSNNNCTVLSIGSYNDFGFENAIVNNYGCNVSTFDHTVSNPTPPSQVSFYPFGIATKSEGQLKTINQLSEIAGLHNKSLIDVFKIDCEGCEYDLFSDTNTLEFMSRRIRQLSVEIHWNNNADAISLIYGNLIKNGFRCFSKEPNLLCQSCATEFSFLNLNLLWN